MRPMHGGFRVRLLVEQRILEATSDRPGNEAIVGEIIHDERTWDLNTSEFSEALVNPLAAVFDLEAHKVAPKLGEDLEDGERDRREARQRTLELAAAALRGDPHPDARTTTMAALPRPRYDGMSEPAYEVQCALAKYGIEGMFGTAFYQSIDERFAR